MTMYIKIINGEIEQAPNNIDNIINANLDENLMRELGYKPLIKGIREENHYYNVSYQETDESIIEILEDITENVARASRHQIINEKISKLKDIMLNELVQGNDANVKIIKDVIEGLKLTF